MSPFDSKIEGSQSLPFKMLKPGMNVDAVTASPNFAKPIPRHNPFSSGFSGASMKAAHTALSRILSISVIAILTSLLFDVSAFAEGSPKSVSTVTYGQDVYDAATRYPWAVSLWWAESGTGTPQFICSASAVDGRTVITAAHCVQEDGFYWIRYGGNSLKDGILTPISALKDSEKYSDKLLINDIALLRTLDDMQLSQYVNIAGASHSRKARHGQSMLLGWGDDQNGKSEYLRRAMLNNQDRVAKRIFGRGFIAPLMLAAGRFFKRTGTYAGACYGDSGSSLFVGDQTRPYIVGITSYGLRGCDKKAPTVFTNVSAFATWISKSRGDVLSLEQTDNRSLARSLTPPTISGSQTPDQNLTCSPGTWTANAKRFTYQWKRGTSYYSSDAGSGQSYVVKSTDGGAKLTCTVTAYSDAGPNSASTELTLPTIPSSYSFSASITTSGGWVPGSIASCSVTNASGYDVSFSWFLETSSWSPSLTNAIGSGPSLSLTAPFLTSASNKYLYCVATVSNSMGATKPQTSKSVPSLTPSAPWAILQGTAGTGSTMTCSGTSSTEGVTHAYRWSVSSSYPSTFPAGATIFGTEKTLVLTSQMMASLRGKYLVCEVSASNWAGSASDIDYSYVSSYAS